MIYLTLTEGDFATGFRGELQVGAVKQPVSLPAAVELPERYAAWQTAYEGGGGLGRKHLRLKWRKPRRLKWRKQQRRLEVPPQGTNFSSSFPGAKKALEQSFLAWLDTSGFWRIREAIAAEIPKTQPVQFVLEAREPLLQKLPWHLWELLQERSQMELVLGCSRQKANRVKSTGLVQVLVIFGNTSGLNVEEERDRLQRDLPKGSLRILEAPSRQELSDYLFDYRWDIIYFAGHSRSTKDCQDGWIYINKKESISPEDLCHSFQRSIDRGLQLVILNSCDGLGIGRRLIERQLPRAIVMREPVLDSVAPAFLCYLLKHLIDGDSIPMAVRHTRQRLQDNEDPKSLCASWLPMLMVNPAALEPKFDFRPRQPLFWPLRIGAGLGAIALMTSGWLFVIAPQLWLRDRLSSGEQLLFPVDTQQPLAVQINEFKQKATQAFDRQDYKTAVGFLTAALKLNRNDPESLLYLNNAKIGNQPHLKIAASLPIGSNANVAAELLRGIAQRQMEINDRGGINGKPLWIQLANDNNSTEDVKPIARHFVGDRQIIAVIGSNASNASVPAAEIYNRGKLMMLSPTSFSEKLNATDGPYSASMVPNMSVFAGRLAEDYFKDHPNARIVRCFDSEAADNDAFFKAFENAMNAINSKQGGTAQVITKAQGIDCQLNAPGFNSEITAQRILQSGADTVLITPYIDRLAPATQLAEALNGKQHRVQLLGSPTFLTGEILKLGRSAIAGAVLPAPWHSTAISGSDFPKQAEQLWGGRVVWRTAMAYDAVHVIAAGLRQNPTREGAKLALQQKLAGVTGQIVFSEQSGDRQMTPGIGEIMEIRQQPGSTYGVDFVPMKDNR